MARDPKNKPITKPTQPRFNDVTFVNWTLTADEKTSCKQWLLDQGDMDNAISALIEAGYKITVSWDKYRACYTSSIVPTADAKSNQGFILTGKGSTALKATKQALFIHYHIMDSEWASYSTTTNTEELDD